MAMAAVAVVVAMMMVNSGVRRTDGVEYRGGRIDSRK